MSKWCSILIVLLLITLSSCINDKSTPTSPLPTQALPTETATLVTLTPSFTVVASETVTPSPTKEPTDTQTDTPSPTPSQTMTDELPSLTIREDANCRTGPGIQYEILTHVEVGSSALILGSGINQTWFLIDSGQDSQMSCWVSKVVATLRGNLVSVPELTPPPLPQDTATPTPESKGIVYYLLAENTGGPVGCGDSLIPIYPGINFKPDMETNVKAALNALFAHNTKYVNGLLNPIYESRMKAKHLSFDSSTGVARIQLGGTFVKPVDVCESKRMHAQVFLTVYQFQKIKFAAVFINNVLLGDLMEK
jgi:hypothetical protein